MSAMPITKTAKAKAFLQSGDIKSCLRILKTFKVGISKSEKRSIEIAYECLSGKENFYRQLGINVKAEIAIGEKLAKLYFKKTP